LQDEALSRFPKTSNAVSKEAYAEDVGAGSSARHLTDSAVQTDHEDVAKTPVEHVCESKDRLVEEESVPVARKVSLNNVEPTLTTPIPTTDQGAPGSSEVIPQFKTSEDGTERSVRNNDAQEESISALDVGASPVDKIDEEETSLLRGEEKVDGRDDQVTVPSHDHVSSVGSLKDSLQSGIPARDEASEEFKETPNEVLVDALATTAKEEPKPPIDASPTPSVDDDDDIFDENTGSVDSRKFSSFHLFLRISSE
jgi:hypothetical protein